MADKATLPGLPRELKEMIVKNLGTDSLLALSATNREFFELRTRPKLWAEMRTGSMFLWGHDSTRVLARLTLPRYRHLIQVTISSRYADIRPMMDWTELLTALTTLPKLTALYLQADLSNVEPWVLADIVSTTHCVELEMCFNLDYDRQVAIINSLASPICITRHLIVKDVDLTQALHLCKPMLNALKLLWSLEIDDRCLSRSQLKVLRLVRATRSLKSIRKDFHPDVKCRYHTKEREEAMAASFERVWAAAGMND